MKKEHEYIYKVITFHPAKKITLPNGVQTTGSLTATEHYFGSLAAIYDKFSREEIGCALQRLYELKISDGGSYASNKCIITRHEIHRKAKKNVKTLK